MTENQQAIITKMRMSGKSYGQIAKTLAISKNTVKSFCRRKGLASGMDKNLLLCPECGNITPSQIRRGRKRQFCSDKCKTAWHNKHRILNARNSVEMICPTCGKPFLSYPSANKKHCSRACYMADRFGGGKTHDASTELS